MKQIVLNLLFLQLYNKYRIQYFYDQTFSQWVIQALHPRHPLVPHAIGTPCHLLRAFDLLLNVYMLCMTSYHDVLESHERYKSKFNTICFCTISSPNPCNVMSQLHRGQSHKVDQAVNSRRV